MMCIVTQLYLLHTHRSLGMVQSQLFGNRIEIWNVMKYQDEIQCISKSSWYFAQKFFCVLYYFKIAMPWHVFHPFLLPRGPTALVTLGLQYDVPRSHSRHSKLGRTPWTSDRPVPEPSNQQDTTHIRHTLKPLAKFEPAIPVSERP
jgi:hypothetical protein